MAIRKIVKVGDDVLKKVCRSVLNFDEKLWTLLEDMKQTLIDADGAGLAAPQVGILRRVCIVDVGDGVIELINPVIISEEGEQTGEEGCLSVPNTSGDVERPTKIKISFQDRNGEEHTLKVSGFLARIFCHEYDHLDGILYVDKATDIGEDN